jgi:hypothetical protein
MTRCLGNYAAHKIGLIAMPGKFLFNADFLSEIKIVDLELDD